MASALGNVFQIFGRNAQRLNIPHTNVRYKSIKAAVLKNFKEPLVIDQVKREKKLKKNQIRINVNYCSVNPSDYEIIQGLHEYKPQLPFIPGYELSGEIAEVGKSAKEAGYNEGDKVIALNKDSCGGFAEECVVVTEDCYHVPQGVSLKHCSALLDGYTLALLGLVRRARIEENNTVLVTAAGGGVGLAAVDLAANVYKAKVIAVCSTEDKAALVREKGAFAAIKYNKKTLLKEVKELTDGKGVNVVFDATGGEVFESALQCISNEGKLVLASNAARSIENFSPNVLLPNAASIIGISPWHYRKNYLEAYTKTVEDVIDMAEQELIVPHISQEFELEDVNKAFEYLLDAKCTGKVVINIKD